MAPDQAERTVMTFLALDETLTVNVKVEQSPSGQEPLITDAGRDPGSFGRILCRSETLAGCQGHSDAILESRGEVTGRARLCIYIYIYI